MALDSLWLLWLLVLSFVLASVAFDSWILAFAGLCGFSKGFRLTSGCNASLLLSDVVSWLSAESFSCCWLLACGSFSCLLLTAADWLPVAP